MDEQVQEAIQASASLTGSLKRIAAALSVPCVCGAPVGAFCFPAVRGFHKPRWMDGAVRVPGGVR